MHHAERPDDTKPAPTDEELIASAMKAAPKESRRERRQHRAGSQALCVGQPTVRGWRHFSCPSEYRTLEYVIRSAPMLQKFQAEIRLSPPVTMLHTLTCSVCGANGDETRVVRARNISEAVLDLISTYMSEGVRRNVSVCKCTKEQKKEPRRWGFRGLV